MAYRLQRKEPIDAGVRRVAREQLKQAICELRNPALDRHEAVHQVRTRFKKIRSLARLVRPALGKQYDDIKRWYRDAGRRLSRVRDAETMLETVRRLGSPLVPSSAGSPFTDVEQRLQLRRQRIADEWTDLDDELSRLADELQAARRAAKRWSLAGDEAAALFDGFQHAYKRGVKALADASKAGDDESLHEWRKAMKDQWYHLRLLRGVWKPIVQARVGELARLCELLGDDHDLAVLGQSIAADPARFGDPPTLDLLQETALHSRRQLQQQAFPLGRRICAEPPRALRRRFERYWHVWRG